MQIIPLSLSKCRSHIHSLRCGHQERSLLSIWRLGDIGGHCWLFFTRHTVLWGGIIENVCVKIIVPYVKSLKILFSAIKCTHESPCGGYAHDKLPNLIY